jgi:hypothetical protein
MARTFQMNRFYPAPGASTKVDGFNINISGDAAFQAKLLQLGPLVIKRAQRIMETVGQMMADRANAAAPRGERRKGRSLASSGFLAKSFRVYPRPQWQQLGKVGVAVRSRAKYHHFQEFGVNRPDNQVVLHRNDAGKKVAKGKRYRDGTKRLRDGVRVSTYRRDIIIKANPFFGEVVRRSKGEFEAQAREGLLRYIDRISAGDAGDLGSERAG